MLKYSFKHAGKQYAAYGDFSSHPGGSFNIAEDLPEAHTRPIVKGVAALDDAELLARVSQHFPGLEEWHHEGETPS